MANEYEAPSTAVDPQRSAAPSPQLGDLKDKVSGDIKAARTTIEKGAGEAVEKIKESVTEQTNYAARQVRGFAKALEKVGGELQAGDQPEVGRYTTQIGESVHRFAKQMEGKDIGEVAAMAEDFGRKQPLAFLGIAALAGLAASRFLTASSHRPTDTRGGELNEPRATASLTGGDRRGQVS